jgi:hypothetical protein
MADGQPHAEGLGGGQGPRCSFCGRGQFEAGPLVEGQGAQGAGGVFICAQCVELARKIFEQVQQRPPGETLHDNG